VAVGRPSTSVEARIFSPEGAAVFSFLAAAGIVAISVTGPASS